MTWYIVPAVIVAVIASAALFFINHGTARYDQEDRDNEWVEWVAGGIIGILWPIAVPVVIYWIITRLRGGRDAKH